jgi:aspartate/methionine/tyrosine aminotransferase
MGGLVALAQHHGLTIISDEVYDHFVYGRAEHTSPLSFPDAKNHVILVNSFSKTYAMTGWRVGYIAAPGDAALQFLKYHHTVNICAAAFVQRACIAALEGPQDCINEMIEEYDRRRARMVARVNQIPRLSCVTPHGAFYVFVNIQHLAMPSLEFARRLVEEAGVVTANGSGCGAEGYVRLSYATRIEKIDEALDRIEKVVRRMP